MYFTRFYGSGYGDVGKYDPRGKVWAEYVCSVCDHVHDEDVSRTWNTTFQTRDRICPKCRCTSSEDKAINLKVELEKLTRNKSLIEVEIEKIERELAELETKGA
jgi:rubredoxin